MGLGLQGKVAIVTGGSDGLGLATARRLTERDVPLGRIGEAEELGALVAFLVSAQAAYITGVAINFDGGHSGVV